MSQILKILVCDQNQVFFKYFQKAFPEFNFTFYFDKKDDVLLFNQFNRLIFIQEGPMEEYLAFFKEFEEEIPIIFGIYQKKPVTYKYQMNRSKNVDVLYLMETKKDINDQLKRWLDRTVS